MRQLSRHIAMTKSNISKAIESLHRKDKWNADDLAEYQRLMRKLREFDEPKLAPEPFLDTRPPITHQTRKNGVVTEYDSLGEMIREGMKR